VPPVAGRRHRQAARRLRALRAFISLPGTKTLGFSVLALVAMVVAGGIILDVRYQAPHTGEELGAFEALYLALSLIVLSPTWALPSDWLCRVVFIVVPLAGLVLLGQLIIRLVVAVVNRDRWEVAVASTYHDHVIVCGLGRVGFRVVRWLLDLGEDVVVVDLPDDAERLHDQVRAWGVPIVTADARRTEVLESAGITRCSAIMPITDDDLINLSIATEARSLHPEVRVVLRTFDDRLAANLQQGFDIYRAYSTSALAAPAFAAAATHAPVDYAFAYGDTADERMLFTVTQFTIVAESSLVGWSVQRLETDLDIQVLALKRDVVKRHPASDTVVGVGDGVVVSATPEALDRVACLTPPTRELGRYRQNRWEIRAYEQAS
jgi:Trk K+ transport system NAD-binding subunit